MLPILYLPIWSAQILTASPERRQRGCQLNLVSEVSEVSGRVLLNGQEKLKLYWYGTSMPTLLVAYW